MTFINFDIYIKKTQKIITPNINITEDSVTQLNAFLNHLGKNIILKAETLKNSSKKKTLTALEIQNAVRIVFPSELSKHCVSEISKAVIKYENKKKKAGLIFQPHRAEKLIRKYSSGKVSEKAPVALAASLEYIIAELTELGSNATMYANMKTITPRHLTIAIHNDEELEELLKKIKFKFVRGGVMPNIYSILLKKKSKFGKVFDNTKISNNSIKKLARRGGVKSMTEKVNDRIRRIVYEKLDYLMKNVIQFTLNRKAITVSQDDVWNALETKMFTNKLGFGKRKRAIQEIKKYQKSTNLLITKTVFNRLVRDIGKDYKSDLLFNANAIIMIQSSIESFIVELFQKSIVTAIHAKRTTVNVDDVNFSVKNL